MGRQISDPSVDNLRNCILSIGTVQHGQTTTGILIRTPVIFKGSMKWTEMGAEETEITDRGNYLGSVWGEPKAGILEFNKLMIPNFNPRIPSGADTPGIFSIFRGIDFNATDQLVGIRQGHDGFCYGATPMFSVFLELAKKNSANTHGEILQWDLCKVPRGGMPIEMPMTDGNSLSVKIECWGLDPVTNLGFTRQPEGNDAAVYQFTDRTDDNFANASIDFTP